MTTTSPRQPLPRRRRATERAQAMVEFAMIAPVLFLLMFAVFQVGLVYMQYQQVGFAASEGARCAAVARTAPVSRPACAPAATSPANAAVTRAIAKAPSLDLDAGDVTVSSDSGWALPGRVAVTVRYDTEIPIINKRITLNATSKAKLER